MSVAVLQVVSDISATDQLIKALAGHGFTAVGETIGFDEKSPGPTIPVVRLIGYTTEEECEDAERRLTDLVIGFYDQYEEPVDADTRLEVDRMLDRAVEFDYMLSFAGTDVLVLMPREIFQHSPSLGRTIEQRYHRKLSDFANYLNRHRVR